jgi:aspartate aminotransferase
MTGWRIGYLGATREIAQAIANLQDHSTSNPTSISQYATLAALRGDDSCIRLMVEEFQKRRDYMVGRLKAIEGLHCNVPQGAFYVFCDISHMGIGSTEFAKSLLQK